MEILLLLLFIICLFIEGVRKFKTYIAVKKDSKNSCFKTKKIGVAERKDINIINFQEFEECKHISLFNIVYIFNSFVYNISDGFLECVQCYNKEGKTIGYTVIKKNYVNVKSSKTNKIYTMDTYQFISKEKLNILISSFKEFTKLKIYFENSEELVEDYNRAIFSYRKNRKKIDEDFSKNVFIEYSGNSCTEYMGPDKGFF